MGLQNRIDRAIAMLQRAEPLALKMSTDGFHLAFSGGKDSQVVYHLAKMAGVKFKAHMQITTVDPPELMRFVREHYPDVELHLPAVNFYKLIVQKKMLPQRQARYCCYYLKEQAGTGTVTIMGIRAAESNRRAKRNEVEVGKKFSGSLDQFNVYNDTAHVCVNGKDKIMISPIFGWTTSEVWQFLRGNKIQHCSLYDNGYHRIGCMFCPMATPAAKQRDLLRYPKVAAAIKKSIQALIDGNGYMNNHSATADEVFDWWVSNKPSREYFGMLRGQLKLSL